jgi:hypothetical protein
MRATRILSPVVVVCGIVLSALAGWAEDAQTVRDLLGKGGKRLSKDELLVLVPGMTVSGTQLNRPNVTFEIEYKANGTVSGMARSPTELLGISGKWWVDETGRLCSELWNSLGQRVSSPGCLNYFVLDGAYFVAPTDGLPDRLYPRTIKR